MIKEHHSAGAPNQAPGHHPEHEERLHDRQALATPQRQRQWQWAASCCRLHRGYFCAFKEERKRGREEERKRGREE
eukprot:SAG31_NODE_3790_length_3878_cov_1.766931_1_plen_75_part_10